MTLEEDAVKLVQLFKSRPCLWNPRNIYCANKNVTEQNWKDIATEMKITGHNNSPFPPLPYWPEDETVSQCGAKNGNLVPESTVEPNPSNATNFGNSTGRPKRKESDPVGAATIDNLADGKKMKKAADEPESQSDGDEKFLLSLKDDMKEMTPSQKRTFKRRIFEVLDDILQAPSSSSSGTCPISTSTS